jgi:diacylglycerol kinase family enzyme
VDVGLCFFKDEFGRDKKRYFINIASVGVAGRVAKQVSHTPRFLPPGFAYYSAVVTHFLTYRPQRVKVVVDGKEVFDRPAVNTFVANGRYSGAGMCWAPPARVDDGFLDVVIAEPMPKTTTLMQQHKVYSGSILEVPGMHHFKGKEVMISSQDDVLLEIDGEQPGLIPAAFKVIPKALNLVQHV